MRAAVRANARAFMAPFEGTVPYMYADSLGWVTCGIGNKIDPVGDALALDWVRRTGGVPTAAEIGAEWATVKKYRLTARNGSTRTLILTPEALEKLFFQRLDLNEAYLARRFSDWEAMPADGQMLCHSCAWAAGAGWKAPLFDTDVLQNTPAGWHLAAGTPGTTGNDPALRGAAWLRDTRPEDDAAGVHTPTLNVGLRPRNLANQWLAQNAAVALADGLDLDRLYWPTTLDG